ISIGLKWWFNTQLLAESSNGFLGSGHLLLQIHQFGSCSTKVYLLFGLKRVYIAGYIEVVIVGFYILQGSYGSVFGYGFTIKVGIYNSVYINRAQHILRLLFLKTLAGIYKQYIIGVLFTLLQHQYAGGYAGAVKQVGGQPYNGIYIIALLNKEAAYMSL